MWRHQNVSGINQIAQFENSDKFDIHFKGTTLLSIIVELFLFVSI